MTLGFGADFWAAKQGELYQARSGQTPLTAVLFAGLLVAIMMIMQNVGGLLSMALSGGFGKLFEFQPDQPEFQRTMMVELARGVVISILPISLLVAWLAWVFAGQNNRTKERGIPLHVPDLGIAGWASVVIGMMVFMWAVFLVTLTVLGIDPATYKPSPDGVNDLKSSAGLVEKVIADLADEPLLFALAFPGVTIAVPVAEELIFRGALFSALRHSWFGKTGAVFISALAWAVVHALAAPWLFVFVIFLMGLLLGWLLLRFGSLWVTIACHVAWNTASSIAIFGGSLPGT
jgi:uncharacterized protein